MANSPQEAAESVNPTQWEVLQVRALYGGKRDGAGRVSKWGDSVKTDLYRLPILLETNAEQMISSIEALRTTLEVWESKVSQSQHISGGKTAKRYKYVEQMTLEIKACLSDLPDSLV